MKRASIILTVLILTASAFAQPVQSPTGLTANLSHNSTQVDLQWKGISVAPPLRVEYRLMRRVWYIDPVYGATTYDEGIASDDISDTKYSDNSVLPCMTITYRVIAVVRDQQNGTRESSPSDSVDIQIKGGVNAVVIFPTPKTVAVAGFPFSVQLHACDASDHAVIRFYIDHQPPQASGLTIDSVTGWIRWDVPADVPLQDITLNVRARDDQGKESRYQLRIDVVNPNGASVSGHVKFVGAGPVPVTLRLHGMLPPFSTIAADLDTTSLTYRFPQVDPGPYRLSYIAQIPGKVLPERWYVDASTSDSATSFVVDNSPLTLSPITIRIPVNQGYSIVGVLTHGTSGIAGATVQAFEVSGFIGASHTAGAPKLVLASTVQTAANGAFSVPVVAGGSYMLLATAAGYQSRFLSNDTLRCTSPYCATVFSATKDSIPANGTLSVVDTAGQQIVGTVSSLSDSKGVQAMILFLKNSGGTITSGYSGGLVPFDVVTSDHAGNYRISSVPADPTGKATYLIQAVPFDTYIPAYFAANDSASNLLLWEKAQQFSLSQTKTDPLVVNVQVQPLATGSGTISGHVNETLATGVASSVSAYVYAIDETSLTPAGYALSDGSGNFSITNLPAGTYELLADKIPFHYAIEGEVVIQASDSGRSAGHVLVLSQGPSAVQSTVQPSTVRMSAAWPNPFSGTSMMAISATAGSTLKLYDIFGREVADLTTQLHEGMSLVAIDGSGLAAGTYFAQFRDITGLISRPLIVTH